MIVSRWFVTTLSLTALSCSASDSPGATGSGGSVGEDGSASGAVSSSGAAAGGSGGAGGNAAGASGAGGVSRRAACIAYATAGCERRLECGDPREPGNCDAFVDLCPDAVFSPGSTRTVESVVACAEIFRTFPCEELLRGAVPDCATPGTFEGGADCAFDSQCESLTCDGASRCNTCKFLADADRPCSEPDTVCPLGQYCAATGCVDQVPVEPSLVARLGEACDALTACLDSRCERPSGSSVGVCVDYPTSGPCDFNRCASTAYCNSQQQCVANPTAGQPCAILGSTQFCAAGSVCRSGICELLPGPGGPCSAAPGYQFPSGCQPGLHCVCADDACTSGQCVQLAQEGESCPMPNVCVIGTECRAGVCVGVDSLGLFGACLEP